jgi:hypothetical protein
MSYDGDQLTLVSFEQLRGNASLEDGIVVACFVEMMKESFIAIFWQAGEVDKHC